ncbi:polarity establishment/cellular polarization [Conoideocrella luteorostrata]|uniref:Polarity establishment/cellular polarization n=1 Tax=Conoideocrella luteorostrata TaxID=1105319 RepID=A0AAJ0CGQ8_9HYPO|nr:polarity establishment/cellular polarization [Conoideocrella luteorostrata]
MFDIIATDEKGSANTSATIMISRNPAPKVQIPLEKQITKFGDVSAPSSILSYPSADFNISFDLKTFGQIGLSYYAVSGDGSSLPAWIKFHAPSLSFEGRTPPIESLGQSSVKFNFSLIASDIVSFSASSIEFSIIVGSHKLSTSNPIIKLNATRDQEVTYNDLLTDIKLDGKKISPGDLKVTTKDMPSWFSYDDKTVKLKGIPKNEDNAANFTITFKDSFSDSLDVLVVADVAMGLFLSTLEDVSVKPGSQFDLDLVKYLRNPHDVTVRVSTSFGESWLKVDDLKLSGEVPKASKDNLEIYVEASSRGSDLKEREIFNIHLLSPDRTTNTATSESPTTATTTTIAGNSAVPDEKARPHSLSLGILLATIIPVIFVAILLIVLICCLRRCRTGRISLRGNYRSKFLRPVFNSPQPDPSVRETAGTEAAVGSKTLIFSSAKAALNNISSQTDYQEKGSKIFERSSVSEIPRGTTIGTGRQRSRNVVNVQNEDGRQSWITIDGRGAAMSDGSSRSKQLNTTYPKPTGKILSKGDLIFGKDQKSDIALTTLETSSMVQPTPPFRYQPPGPPFLRQNTGRISTMTSTAATIPTRDNWNHTSIANRATSSIADPVMSSETSWTTLAESTAGESVNREIGGIATKDLRSWREGSSADGSRSFNTETSFQSCENWRVISAARPTKIESSK